uniref:Macaca fascicularis brain cDNA clone: QflA-22768, similar to human solute carrier family 17 (sodium-dependent inorganicphosphate cotransporter), member 7 (SLC17A7), mRNA, RefSeq: NM_020309.2 n=1 Tax=Macaca fascicularis TaxID=9541 RepID=I7GML2_MACFA|nr:unnamed protein product [Macaca fascicularis]
MGPTLRTESPGDDSLLRFLCWGGGRDAPRRGPCAVLRMELCFLRLRQLRDLLVPVLAARVLRVPRAASQHLGGGAQVHRGRHRRERETHEPPHEV